MKDEPECTEPPVNYSSTVIANIVEVLTGTQSTMMDTPTASSVKHLSLVTQHTMSLVELELFFREHR